MGKAPNETKVIAEKQEEQASTFPMSMNDDREPIVQNGDQNNAFLPRFVLTPYAGLGSSLSHKA